jgi:hypothetical protein
MRSSTALPEWQVQLRRTWLLLLRFTRRYGKAVLALVIAAVIGWTVASGVSDYTNGGWEIHFIQRELGINLHLHHWFYGIPLYLLAFALIERNTTVSIFLFGLGETLSAHSFINEGGIPSIFEGGPTLRIPPEIYFPLITALTLFYAFFLIRREEWILRAREREEIAESYLCPKARMNEVLQRLDGWAAQRLRRKKYRIDPDTKIEYGYWHALDLKTNGEWELFYTVSPFDEELNLLVVRIEHVPLEGRTGQLDDWIRELDAALRPLAQPAVEGPEAARQVATVPAGTSSTSQ